MSKEILITGGSGFIGSNLVNHFLNKKYKVINIDKLNYSSTPDRFKYFSNNIKYKFFRADLVDKKKIYSIIKKYKPKVIFNLASETHVDRSIDTPVKFVKNNILSSLNLVDIIRKIYSKKK